jgi:acyl-coenzyme A thioesterase PaaI-like protein
MFDSAAPPAPPVPLGYPPEGMPTAGRSYLDALVAGTARTPAAVDRLVLPPPTRWSRGSVTAVFCPDDDVTLSAGVVFGGYIGCLVDHFAGLAMMTVLPDESTFLTAEMAIRFRAPLRPAATVVTATVHALSRRQATVEVLLAQQGRPASTATVEQIMIRRPAVPLAAARSAVVV